MLRRFPRIWLTIVLALLSARCFAIPQETNALAHYCFRETTVLEELDSNGKIKSTETEVKQVFPVEGYLFAQMVSRNGKPLAPDEELKEKQRLEKFRNSIRQGKKPKESGTSFDSVSAEFGDVQDGAMQEGVSVEKAGNELINQRNCIIYLFSALKKSATNTPQLKLESKSKDADAKKRREFGRELMKSIRGKIWVDEEDHSPARLDMGLERPMHIAFCMVTIKQLDFHVDFRRLEPKLWTSETATADVSIKALFLVNSHFRLKMTRDEFIDARGGRP